MRENITLKDVRFNWLDVLIPKPYKDSDKTRYRAEVIFEPGTEAHNLIEAALLEAANDKWPGKGEGMVKVVKSSGKCCMKIGDEMPLNKKTMEIPAHYLGNIVLATSRATERDGAPRVYCKRTTTGKLVEVFKGMPITEDMIRPVSGNYGNIMVSVWGWEHEGSPQLNCTLDAISFMGEGEALGGGSAPLPTDDEVATAFGAEIEEVPF